MCCRKVPASGALPNPLQVPHKAIEFEPVGFVLFFGGITLANIKSQIKRDRQNEKRRLRNRVVRGTARAAVRDARATIEEGKLDEAALVEAISKLDKAVSKGVLHKNNAARRKSRLMKAFAAAKA